MTLNSEALEPCPFCGCTDISRDDDGDYEWLKCDWCGATSGFDPAPEFEGKTLEWHWNRRPALPSGDELVEGLNRWHLETVNQWSDEYTPRASWEKQVSSSMKKWSEASYEAATRLQSLMAEVAELDAECQQSMLDIARERVRAEAAEARVKVLEEALTPSGDTKAAYIGEFSMGLTLSAGGEEEYRSVQIPWTSIKEIMAAIRERALGRTGE